MAFTRVAGVLTLLLAMPVIATAQTDARLDPAYHHATHLGSPTSLYVPGVADERRIRDMIRPPAMQDDIRTIMRDAGLEAVAADVIAILQTGQVDESTARTSCDAVTPVDNMLRACRFPQFGKLEWMAYRPGMSVTIKKADRRATPALLPLVQWAGWSKPAAKDPTFPAYVFRVVRAGAEYTFILPQPCANLSLLKAVLPPQLTLTKSVDKLTADPGNDLTYTLAYANTGKGAANDLVLKDTLPRLTTFKQASNSGTASGSDVTWNLGSLAAGASGTVTLIATIAPKLPVGTTDLTNNSTLTSRELAPLSARAVTTVTVKPRPPALSLEKTVDHDRANAGDVLTYALTYANTGESAATGAVLQDTLPSGVTYEKSSPAAAVSGSELTWALGTLEPGVSSTATIVARLKPTFPVGDTTVVNPATLSAAGLPSVKAEARTVVTVLPPPPHRVRFLADVLVGKDRRVRPADPEEGRPFDFAQCSPEIGVKLGVSRLFASQMELAATGGVALSLVGSEKVREHALFIDGEVNRHLARGFVGTGVSLWDLTRSDTFRAAWLLHGGVTVHHGERVTTHFLIEGRLFLKEIDDVANNYQFWGGLRFTFKH